MIPPAAQLRIGDEGNALRTFAYSECFLCGTTGVSTYTGVQDRISVTHGAWTYKRCENPECSLFWLDPMPSAEDIGKAYQDYFTHDSPLPVTHIGTLRRIYRIARAGYLSQRFKYPIHKSLLSWGLGKLLATIPTRANYVDFQVMYLPFCDHGRLLDIGCGSGGTLRIMSELGWSVEGIDFDPVVAKKARCNGLNVRFGTLEEQAYGDNTFDAIVLSHVIEHIYKPLNFLSECSRILKPGGRLVILTPNVESWGHRHFKDKWLYLDPPRHLHLFSHHSLNEACSRAGLRTIESKTSARTAGRMFVGSRDIKKSGRHNASKALPSMSRIFGELTEFAEWLYCRFDRYAGEELVLTATKSRISNCWGQE